MQYYVIRDKETGLYWRGKSICKRFRFSKDYDHVIIFRTKEVSNFVAYLLKKTGVQAEIVPILITEGVINNG